MIGGRVARHTLTRLRPARVSDGRGGLRSDWSDPDTLEIPGWAIGAGNTLEDRVNREGARIEYTANGPFSADVEGTDRILYAGHTYEIDGDVIRQPGPTDRTSHTIIALVRWRG